MLNMKDSGIKWIGEIPNHWKIVKYKYLLSLNSGISLVNSMLEDNLKYKVYGGGKVIGTYSDYNVNEDNLLIGRVGSCGSITYLNNKAWATDNALIITLNKLEEKRYIYYLLLASDLNKLNTSNAQPLITVTKILNFKIPYTDNMQEQQKIANFLDEKCDTIDELTKDIQSQIETLENYKKSIIAEAITKGLNPNVEMKDSGIEWIGKMPKEWSVIKNNLIFDVIKNKCTHTDYQVLSLTKNGVKIRDISNNDGQLPNNYIGYSILNKGDT